MAWTSPPVTLPTADCPSLLPTHQACLYHLDDSPILSPDLIGGSVELMSEDNVLIVHSKYRL